MHLSAPVCAHSSSFSQSSIQTWLWVAKLICRALCVLTWNRSQQSQSVIANNNFAVLCVLKHARTTIQAQYDNRREVELDYQNSTVMLLHISEATVKNISSAVEFKRSAVMCETTSSTCEWPRNLWDSESKQYEKAVHTRQWKDSAYKYTSKCMPVGFSAECFRALTSGPSRSN